YVAHGTRSQAGVTEAKIFISYYMKHVPVPIQVMSFIDFVFPAVHEGIDLCVAKGAKNIAIVPLFLLEAGPAKNVITKMIKKKKRKKKKQPNKNEKRNKKEISTYNIHI